MSKTNPIPVAFGHKSQSLQDLNDTRKPILSESDILKYCEDIKLDPLCYIHDTISHMQVEEIISCILHQTHLGWNKYFAVAVDTRETAFQFVYGNRATEEELQGLKSLFHFVDEKSIIDCNGLFIYHASKITHEFPIEFTQRIPIVITTQERLRLFIGLYSKAMADGYEYAAAVRINGARNKLATFIMTQQESTVRTAIVNVTTVDIPPIQISGSYALKLTFYRHPLFSDLRMTLNSTYTNYYTTRTLTSADCPTSCYGLYKLCHQFELSNLVVGSAVTELVLRVKGSQKQGFPPEETVLYSFSNNEAIGAKQIVVENKDQTLMFFHIDGGKEGIYFAGDSLKWIREIPIAKKFAIAFTVLIIFLILVHIGTNVIKLPAILTV